MDHDPNYVFDDGFHRPFWPHPFDGPGDPHFFHGFGMEPGRWPHRWFGWSRRPEIGIGHRSPFDAPDAHVEEDFSYMAPSHWQDGEGRIEIFFPAQDQLFCGDYKLVVVVTVYEAGWGRHNLHTYTIDKGVQFSLVDTSDGVDGDVIWDANEGNIETDKELEEVKFAYNHLYIKEGSTLKLGDRDVHGVKYDISCKLTNGDYVEYKPKSWRYNTLIFSSDDHTIADVEEDGSLIVAGSYNKAKDTTVLRIKDSQTGEYYDTRVVVTVIKDADANSGTVDVAFADTLNYSDINFYVYGQAVTTEATVINPNDGNYLWIKAVRPLQHNDDGAVVVCGVTTVDDTTKANAIIVPMELPEVSSDGFYYYRSSGKIAAGNMHIHIDF